MSAPKAQGATEKTPSKRRDAAHKVPRVGGRSVPEVARDWLTAHPSVHKLTLGPQDAPFLIEIYEDYLSRNGKPPLPSGTDTGRIIGIIARAMQSLPGRALFLVSPATPRNPSPTIRLRQDSAELP